LYLKFIRETTIVFQIKKYWLIEYILYNFAYTFDLSKKVDLVFKTTPFYNY